MVHNCSKTALALSICAHLISSVPCANNLDERDRHCFEANELP